MRIAGGGRGNAGAGGSRHSGAKSSGRRTRAYHRTHVRREIPAAGRAAGGGGAGAAGRRGRRGGLPLARAGLLGTATSTSPST
ncbi:hypothetical protein HMPREF0682_0184 [Propionibacterium acidifaciens F0233]|uniref:Uncharacterized protein n=1 Tax=Propionibacterium acidifaciens F0233 TaxID=553198 RepID=U2R174_9ACTN|nr:hypothetical protein HMPREF0682_0184 [Propionibacterium acidifaciens F0233]